MIKKILIGLMMVGLLFMIGCDNIATDDDVVFCTEEYAPVCGVDGVTYSNACYAGNVEIAYEGECGSNVEDVTFCTTEYAPVCGVDGVTYGNACNAGNVEIAYEGECGDTEAMLAREPFACTREYMPVCGADGITYSNRCEAGNMTILHEGECDSKSDEQKLIGENLQSLCEGLDGKWIDVANECEGISPDQCRDLGGNYNECASACRNDPDAVMCTLQCVFVCEFN